MSERDKNGLLLVVSGPSGVGKTTIVHEVIRRLGGEFSVSATTRERSGRERDGVDYHFVNEETFQQWINEGRFLEHAQVFGRSWYGTLRNQVEDALAQGSLIVLDIDVQGARDVKRAMPSAFSLFVLPPDETALLKRLHARGREDEAAIDRRFAEAKKEIEFAKTSGVYDAFVINDDLEIAIDEVTDLVRARR
ncbi:MAG: guanylate kinase [Planctomycetota bacterium]|jgi:guanylate kinase|nr:MAG: guanylate kinase [Planctomycetota bacterium]